MGAWRSRWKTYAEPRVTKPKRREFEWSTHQRYQRSPCGCGRTAIWTEASRVYRVVWFRDQKDRPYFAQRYRADLPGRIKYEVVGRESSLWAAQLGCEQHAARGEPDIAEPERVNEVGDRIPPR
jgi:hypothetical protein